MRWTVLALLCLCCLVTWAQPPLHFRHFGERDGLTDLRVTALLRDRQGFLWVGTENGLHRFDGYRFKLMGLAQGFPGGEYIQELEQDTAGGIWIATNRGLVHHDPHTKTFRLWVNEGHSDGSLPNISVLKLALDHQQQIWLATDNRGVCRYDAQADKFIQLPYREFILQHPELAADAYLAVYELEWLDATTLLVGGNHGYCVWSLTNGKFMPLHQPMPLPLAGKHEYCSNVRYFGTWESDVVRMDACTWELERLPLPLPAQSPPSAHYVSRVVPFSGGHCVLTRNGFYFLQGDSIRAADVPVEMRADQPVGLLRTGLADEEGNLWLGGQNGLWLAAASSNRFTYQPIRREDGRVQENHFSSVLSFMDGTTALSFYDNALLVLDSERGKAQVNLPGGASLMEVDRRGRLWVGAGNHLLRWPMGKLSDKFLYINPLDFFPMACYAPGAEPIYDPHARGMNHLQTQYRYHHLPLPDVNQSPTEVKVEAPHWQPPLNGVFTAMVEPRMGQFWLGHSESGLLLFDEPSSTWWHPDSSDGFLSKVVNCLVHDSLRNCLWIGTMDYGLYQMDYATRRFTLHQPDVKAPTASLAGYMVRGLALDQRGRLWAATDGDGISVLWEWNGGQLAFRNLTLQHGLPSNRCISLAMDPWGRMWIGTLGGLACADPSRFALCSFGKADGLHSNFLDMPLQLLTPWDMTISTRDGVMRFNPDQLLAASHKPQVHLTSLRVFEEELLDSLYQPGTPLRLSWRDNYLTFEVASASIGEAARIRFAYRLQGLHDNWHDMGASHEMVLSHLPPGSYVLQVRTGLQGIWAEPGLSIPLVISPPFWATWWFRLCVVLFLAAAVTGAWRLRLRQVRRQEAVRREFEQKLAQTEMAALRAQMNPHFVFNCLSSINRFILVNQPDEASGYLTKFSRLIRLILDNSRTDTVLLSRELDALRLYMELEQMRFSSHFEWRITVDAEVRPETQEIPPLLIQPYVENAIWHGLMHKQGDCLLTLHISRAQGRLVIVIEDNGIGRAKAQELKSRSATQQKSHGMKVTQERISAINRIYGTHAEVHTQDLLDASGAPAGTRVTLTL